MFDLQCVRYLELKTTPIEAVCEKAAQEAGIPKT
jgi:hypothetical protein